MEQAISVGDFATNSWPGLSFAIRGGMLEVSSETTMGSTSMPRSILFRSAFAAVLALALLPTRAWPRSQDSQSVAEAARRTREKKKDAAKPKTVITDETLDVKKGDVQSAAAEEAKVAGAPETNANSANPSAAPNNNSTGSTAAPDAKKDEKLKKELAALQEQLKIALTDLDLLRRENRLDQDAYYSKPNYGADTAGKQKLDDETQRIADKQQEVDNLKTKIADLEKEIGSS